MRKNFIIIIALLLTGLLNAQQFGKNKVQTQKIIWGEIKTIHFNVFYPKNEELFGKICASMAEEAYYSLKNKFQTPILKKIPIIVYRSQREFSTTNIIYPLLSEGVGGFTEYTKNRVVLPFDGSYLKLEEVLIHELTHAYVNAIKKQNTTSQFLNISVRNLPFWFSEGLAEYMSIGGKDSYNNMFVMDLLVNDNIPFLDNIGGYYAYRLGESYLTFLSNEYGYKKVMDYFYATTSSKDMDEASQKVYNFKFKKMQQLWKIDLKKQYNELLMNFQLPFKVAEQRTDSEESGIGSHTNPEFSPNGEFYVYYSQKDFRTAIYLGHTLTFEKDKLLLVGEKDYRFEEFHFQRSNLSWFPDNRRIAFASKSSTYDKIYILNIKNKNIEKTLSLSDFDAIYELDVSNDGNKIVFSAQKNSQDDLFVYDLNNDSYEQITNDFFSDSQPMWDYKDERIVFTSEIENKNKESEHFYYNLEKKIFIYDTINKKKYKVTFEDGEQTNPVWTSDGNSILYISDEKKVFNIKIIDLIKNKSAWVTNVLSGINSFDIDNNNNFLITSIFFNKAWNIYIFNHPIKDLKYKDCSKPILYNRDNIFSFFDEDNFKLLGENNNLKKNIKKERRKNSFDIMTPKQFEEYKNRLNNKNALLDIKPQKINPPEIKIYNPLKYLNIDYLWGGLGYSAGSGIIGSINMNMSDLMGNHAFAIKTNFAGEFKESDIILTYLYLTKRIDYGGGIFHTSENNQYRINWGDGTHDYFKEIYIEEGIYSLIRYPFSKFWRIDIEQSISSQEKDWKKWNWLNDKWKYYNEEIFTHNNSYIKLDQIPKRYIYAPSITFVKDNTLYSSVGPISGTKLSFLLRQAIAKKEQRYNLAYLDFRNYLLFAKKFSFVSRFIAGYSSGDNRINFNLDSSSGVRGYDDNYEEEDEELSSDGFNSKIVRSKKLAINLELRYPLLDLLQLSFPFPILIGNIRGAAFADIGISWDKEKDTVLIEEGELQDIKLGMGFGPRINIGFTVLQMNVAWNTNLSNFSKPSYYFYLSPEF